jgi:hypothetical protein
MAVGGIRVDRMSMLAPRRARAVLAAAGAALVTLVAVQAAFAEAPRTSFTVADQAAARAAVLRASDLGTGWTGTVKKSAVEGPTPCPGWSPRQADLVITGAAESQLSAQGVFVFSSALVYKSTRMIALDWQRTVVGLPVRCLAGQFTAGAGDQLKIVSIKRMPFPKLATYSARFRVVADYQGNATGRVFVDAVLVGRGRTAASIGLVAPYAQRADADAAEVRLAKIVLARIKA